MYEETTIAAIATSPGEGGIGIIRISGMQAADVADRVFHTKKIKSFHEAEPYRMYFGRVMEGDRQVDEGLAVYMKSPHSYTGEDVVEIQIHGSMEALRQTLSLVLEKGAVPAHRGEFTKRAFLNGRLDLSQAEAVMDIIEAKGAAALSQAESHLSGALSSFVRASRDQLKDLIAKLEVTIDYPEEDLEDLTNEEIEEGLSAIDASLRTLLSRSEEGRIIRDGLRTAIVGRPNAGKSSLLNALLQEERAIVTDIPGTTRDTIEESIKIGGVPLILMDTAIKIGGVPLILMDTAGIRETENKIERIGIERAKKSMEKADLIMAVIDGSRPLSEEDRALLASLRGRKALVILNKYDLPQEIETRDVKALAGDIPVVPISARYGSGMAELEEELHHITQHQDVSAGRELFLTNLRHVDLVKKALADVRRAEESIRSGMPADCITIDVTEAWHTLGEITGDTVDQELINSIFERFCVGK
ncbi:tRNA modification GTPase MnmE [Dialister sp. CAG:486]|nr:tRNA modification GTPase MnmE [Dialister sp. CAG:486]